MRAANFVVVQRSSPKSSAVSEAGLSWKELAGLRQLEYINLKF